MRTSDLHIEPSYIQYLKDKYFFDPSKIVVVRKDDYVLRQHNLNKRLFLILEGLVAGYIESGPGSSQEIFRSEENMFVGVHSFFSKSYVAYADVIALKNSRMAYIDLDDFNDTDKRLNLEDFVPVFVNELSARQVIMKDIMLEKESALKKLYESDKLATLGQMAAGLAHELNNAIGVIDGNSAWIAQEVYQYFRQTEIDTIFSKFEQGFKTGQNLPSAEVRKKRQAYEKKMKISPQSAKKLARIDFDEKDIPRFAGIAEMDELIDRMHHFWEMGVAIHDILMASEHAVHVLKSIKQLSVSDQARRDVNLEETIKEALTLVKNLVREVHVAVSSDAELTVLANKGELVQIWVNLIRNACESMLNANMKDARLAIEVVRKSGEIRVAITDNGPGIQEDLLDKIFQPNFTTKKGGLSFGLGLGLTIVRRLVDSYSGKVEVGSKPGETTFTIILPVN